MLLFLSLALNRIRRISSELLERYPQQFGIDFDQNKETLKNLANIRSKLLRNRIAGFITAHVRRETMEKGKVDSETEEPEI
jgi:small subunit ribosomal protein S17e